MAYDIFLYVGSVVIFIWGIAHLLPTKSVVNGFGKYQKTTDELSQWSGLPLD